MADDRSVNLDGIALLGELTDTQREAVAKQCVPLSFSAQQQIIGQDTETTNVYFVLTGKVRVVNYSLSGREVSLEDVEAGGHFGELAAIDGQPRSASVMAYTDTELASMSPQDFNKLLNKYRRVSRQVMMSLAGIVRRSTDRIMDLSTLGANNRVHAEILRQAKNHMTGDNTALIEPISMQVDIASFVSTSRETVVRAMNDLARQGIIKRRKGALEVIDVARLTTLVETVTG